ncbi:hypothetical protein VNO77_23394 [Canavalia gladiata]|uniref:Uncharacterized protein n=1 Tax=Canavalia gladiata TaxID=3824 RepID=A0AAN9L6U7_CANGL
MAWCVAQKLVPGLIHAYARFISQSHKIHSTKLLWGINQEINELVAEQQKIDAKRAHDKSEMEQLKQDIANTNKQKKLISKALEKKKEKSLVDV